MEVIRSKNAGACYGVQRALDLALKASEGDGSAFTLGPLIHNPQVVANLEAVSYTHLDVYKRQTPRCMPPRAASWRSSGCARCATFRILTSSRPMMPRASSSASV